MNEENEYIYCAVNEDNEIQWVIGSSSKTRYFRDTRYLKQAVEYHNRNHAQLWHIQKYKLVAVEGE